MIWIHITIVWMFLEERDPFSDSWKYFPEAITPKQLKELKVFLLE